MRRQWLGTIGFAAALLLMVPRAASAGFGEVVDIIIGLTGPQMVGAPVVCEFNLGETNEKTARTACYISAYRIRGPRLPDTFWEDRDLWASLGGGVYTSTAKDSEMRQFSWFDVGLLAFEPMLNWRSVKTQDARFVLEHGTGATLFYLFGDGFAPFAKSGIKVRPIAGTVRFSSRHHLSVAYNLRIFPDAFTSADFGASTSTNTHGGREIAHGVTLTFGY